MSKKWKKERFVDFVKRQWILIWLAAVSTALVAVIGYAAYKSENNKIKRVVAPSSASDGLFTSNYLKLGDSNKKPYYSSNESSEYSFDLLIRNFNPSDPSSIYPGDITYTITAELVHFSGALYNLSTDSSALAKMENDSISIDVGLGTDVISLDHDTLSGSSSQPHTLAKISGATADEWTVTFTNTGRDSDYCVKITATPTNSMIPSISSLIYVATTPEPHSQDWSGDFSDKTKESGVDIADHYDAFNYTISGSGDKQLIFSYDPAKLIISPMFCASPSNYQGSNPAHSSWKSVVINATPSTTNINRYDFQLYKAISGASGTEYSSFDTLRGYVELEVRAIPAGNGTE
jgi:hypothetical protein